MRGRFIRFTIGFCTDELRRQLELGSTEYTSDIGKTFTVPAFPKLACFSVAHFHIVRAVKASYGNPSGTPPASGKEEWKGMMAEPDVLDWYWLRSNTDRDASIIHLGKSRTHRDQGNHDFSMPTNKKGQIRLEKSIKIERYYLATFHVRLRTVIHYKIN